MAEQLTCNEHVAGSRPAVGSRRIEMREERSRRVLVEEPHVSSMAAGVLLSHGYRMDEVDRWLAFKGEFLDDFEEEHGRLFCEYCGKEPLLRELPEGVKRSAMLATVDHVRPLSKGGPRCDRRNVKLACTECNRKKADKMPG